MESEKKVFIGYSKRVKMMETENENFTVHNYNFRQHNNNEIHANEMPEKSKPVVHLITKSSNHRCYCESLLSLIFVIWFLVVTQFTGSTVSIKLEIPRFFNQTDRQILTHILQRDIYDKHLSPHSDSTLVNVSVILLTLFSPDESSLKYEVEFLMNQVWTDSRLQYEDTSKRYQYLNALPVRENMWVPDTYFILHGEFKYPTEPMHMALKIYPNGTVLYTSR
jgi:hypothetical protein